MPHGLQYGDEDCQVEVTREKSGRGIREWRGGDSTHIYKQRTYEPSLHGQDSTKDRPATPALPRLPLLQLDICSGAKSGLTAYRQRVLMVAHQGKQDRPLR